MPKLILMTATLSSKPVHSLLAMDKKILDHYEKIQEKHEQNSEVRSLEKKGIILLDLKGKAIFKLGL